MQVEIKLEGVKRKLSKDALRSGRYAVTNQALADMNQFVPMREGNLRTATSMSLDGSEITYHMPYAKAHFYAPDGWNYTTPGTGPHWDDKASGIYMEDWKMAFTKGAGW